MFIRALGRKFDAHLAGLRKHLLADPIAYIRDASDRQIHVIIDVILDHRAITAPEKGAANSRLAQPPLNMEQHLPSSIINIQPHLGQPKLLSRAEPPRHLNLSNILSLPVPDLQLIVEAGTALDAAPAAPLGGGCQLALEVKGDLHWTVADAEHAAAAFGVLF
jgi:hypothetical protein